MGTPSPAINMLRKTIRSQRQAIPTPQRRSDTVQVCRSVLQLIDDHQPLHVGVYLSFGEEIDTTTIIDHLWQRAIQTYAPVVNNDRHLAFVSYSQHSILDTGPFGIRQPQCTANNPAIKPAQLDWVFTPLVGFNTQGYRLGMGGGYYDTTFASSRRPLLCAIAFDCQYSTTFTPSPWDIRLDYAVTPSRVFTWG